MGKGEKDQYQEQGRHRTGSAAGKIFISIPNAELVLMKSKT